MTKISALFFFTILTLLLHESPAAAQEKRELVFRVSYVSATTIYLAAGRDDSLAIGDTMIVEHEGSKICSVVAIAVSKHSTASQIVSGKGPVLVGDTVRISKVFAIPEPLKESGAKLQVPATHESSVGGARPETRRGDPAENIVSGRVAMQYSGVSAEDSRFNLSQPSALTRIEISRLFGTQLRFSMYGRSYYDLSANYNRFGNNSRLNIRMYEFTLSEGELDGLYGYSVGRVTSRFVGGMGTFDGAQMYYRVGEFTSGILYGAQVGDRTMSIDGDDRRGALFVNYRYGADFLHQYDGTIAYARQLYEGKLDREFFYIQNLATIGSEFNLYQSAEVETQEINNGVRTTSPKLSNMFLSFNYFPLQWLSTNIGYDASKTVYLFETMKATPDTLIDRSYLQGYRASVTVRLPSAMSVSANGTYRARKSDPRDASTFGGNFRMSAIAGSDYNASLRYMRINGVYNDGNNITVDVDRTFFYFMTVALRYDYYSYTLLSNVQTYTTHTATANVNYRISHTWYSSLNVDRIWDSTLNSYRFYLETGLRF